jgi:hypothetical protein
MFNELNPAASGYTLVMDEEFTNPSSIDTNNTLQPGFNWYLARPYRWPATQASELLVNPTAREPGGSLTINPATNVAAWQLATAAVTPGGSVVGTTWGPGRGWYLEVSILFDDVLARAHGSPAVWMEAVEHMTGRDQWEGQPGYQHFTEIDIFEYNTYGFMGNGSFGSYRHDWYGTKAPYLEAGYTGYMAIVPSPPPVWTSWHKISALYIPGGSIQMWFNDVPYQYTNGLGTVVPFTWTGGGNGKPPIAIAPGNPSAYSEIDHNNFVIVLGACVGCPLQVGYVKMWTAP